jgi:hypothetical protein
LINVKKPEPNISCLGPFKNDNVTILLWFKLSQAEQLFSIRFLCDSNIVLICSN